MCINCNSFYIKIDTNITKCNKNMYSNPPTRQIPGGRQPLVIGAHLPSRCTSGGQCMVTQQAST